MDDLTPIQRKVLESFRRRADLGDAPPTYRDLCREFGWASTGTARDHLRALARKGFLELSGGRARLVRLKDPTQVARVPFLGHVIAGSPVPTEEMAEGRVPVPADWIGRSSAFALRVYGDSMIGAGVHDGDVVIVREQATAGDGDVVAATIDGETTLKRLRLRTGRTFLAAENPAFPDIEVIGEELEIHGVAVGLLRRFAGCVDDRTRRGTSDSVRYRLKLWKKERG